MPSFFRKQDGFAAYFAIAFGASLVRMKRIAVTAQSAYGCAMIGQYSPKLG
jgi:hypothetical protein